jgi:hypothetical protein
MSDTSGARACARARNAHIPWDKELPPELWIIVLRHMTLMQLRLLKTVSHSMANRCRRVLCSSEWRAWAANDYAIEMEVATQAATNYTLPLQVSFFEEELHGTAGCYGTVHRLKLKLVTDSEVADPDPLLPSNWAWSKLCVARLNTPNHVAYRIALVDMLIEVNGRGLCGSEYALRRVLADVCNDPDAHCSIGAEQVCGAHITQFTDEDGSPDGGEVMDEEGNQMSLRDLLMHISPVTRWGTDRPIPHRVTHQNECGRDCYYLDLLHLCSNYPGVIT